MKTLLVGKEHIAYKESGQGSTIVLLHGFCGNVDYWDYIVPVLAEKYHVLCMDLRGHGHSSFQGGDIKIEDLAKDIHLVLEKLSIEKVTMLGHSLGGYVSLAFAELYPEKLAGFGLIHSTAFQDTEEGKEGRLHAIKKIQDFGIESFVDGLVPNLFADDSKSILPKEIEKAKDIGYKTNQVAAMETQAAMRVRPDRNKIIADSKVPVLLVKGIKDKIVPLNRVTSSSGSTITEVELDAGHMSMLEAPEQLARTIQSFVEKNIK
ncbi:alpha/beta fold hydrolase [Bacillus sp. B1-b2]|uniref:alpha/beta fold hydrolase n=1 Tax=Bacillus sp. B1-b2 TaxID=2653201 RepID=UPI0012627873|nr:alpha/beta hydrolase [Bacillus sp. B1-b2]KAB7672968.1 alpha/beta hydrolase [Bacillus sp. B1-b2]